MDATRPSILIIEDSWATGESLRKLFGREGWDSVHFTDGYKAFEHLHTGAETRDAYMVDLRLPGKNGVSCIELIKIVHPRSPRTGLPPRIIAYTAWGMDEQISRAIDAGIHAVIYKPCRFERVLAIVKGEDAGDVEIPPKTE